MFEFCLRVLDVGRGSFLGIVEGFPEILVHAASAGVAEADLVRALVTHLDRLQNREPTWLQLDDFPTVRSTRIMLMPPLG
ncbi:MAG: hypothetical protein L3K07_09430 [Thermoplasmata archaeon]|nr:hypothetical protein [Thermoplasmata archaeon]